MLDNSSRNYSLGLIAFSLIPHSEVWNRTLGSLTRSEERRVGKDCKAKVTLSR